MNIKHKPNLIDIHKQSLDILREVPFVYDIRWSEYSGLIIFRIEGDDQLVGLDTVDRHFYFQTKKNREQFSINLNSLETYYFLKLDEKK